MSKPTPPGPPRPEIAELTCIVAELGKLEEARRPLLARRAALVAELARSRPPEVPVASAGPPPEAAAAGRGRRELSRRTVARLLLAAGGALVVIAAAVFTVANWGSMGPAGRGAVLLAVTALAAGSISGPRPVVIALAATTAGDLALAAWAGRARLAAERRVGCVAAVAAAVAAAATATLTVPAALGPAGWAGCVEGG